MKRKCFVVMGLLLACLAAQASANSWGLRGKLLGKVSDVHTWDDYAVHTQSGDAAVMCSRYHNVLMLLVDGGLTVCHTAVYQPDAGRDGELSLALDGERLTLAYGESEWYVFECDADGYVLTEAAVNDFHLARVATPWGGFRYEAYEGEEWAVYAQWRIGLEAFRITLFPHSVEEVRHLNEMLAALDSGTVVFSSGAWQRRSGVGEGTAPVYAAPFAEASWRAGKAAVGLNGEFWLMGASAMHEGERYVCIRYDVSDRTQRIGYVRAKDIGEAETGEQNPAFINVNLVARCDTYLTDDPDVSQFAQFAVPAGTQLTCMAVYDDEYAYVGSEVRDGRFAGGGHIVWGFVPLRDLDRTPGGPEPMEQLVGSWTFYAGGNQAQDELTFYPDGTYRGVSALGDDLGEWVDTGTYAVTAYDPASNLYWNDPPYELTLRDHDGTVNIKGLVFDEMDGRETFSLTFWEGGGGYVRVGDEEDEGR